jgi:hypothetical protein
MSGEMHLDDTLSYLTASWRLERRITDHLARTAGSFAGSATVRAAGRRARYEERGRLRFGGYDGQAHRRLDLVATAGGAVAVQFADGRPFFELDLVNGTCVAVHPCRQDRYELDFEVRSPDVLLERWRVTGPLKDYEAQTTWRRLEASVGPAQPAAWCSEPAR